MKNEVKKILNVVCSYYEVPEEKVLHRGMEDSVRKARYSFYWICFKRGINLYELSLSMGKHRTTVITNIKKKYAIRDKQGEKIIFSMLDN